jgi:hypothetical protein
MSGYPFGECECRDGCRCEHSPGPAAFSLKRGAQSLKVCTRCDLSGDTDKKLLLASDTPIKLFADYDLLGAFCFANYATADGSKVEL